MAFKHIRWCDEADEFFPGYDLHLMTGGNSSVSVPLSRYVEVTYTDSNGDEQTKFAEKVLDGADSWPDESEIDSLTFETNLKDDSIVSVSDSGKITLKSYSSKLHNFLLTVKVTLRDSDPDRLREEPTLLLYVHLHDQMNDVWLTPSTLSVRQGAHNAAFTILCRFDDGVMADITEWHRRVEGMNPPKWHSEDSGVVSVDAHTGQLTVKKVVEDEKVKIYATGIPDLQSTGAANVRTLEGWASSGKHCELELLAGAGPDTSKQGLDRWRHRPNILFIPDGFTEKEKDGFHSLIRMWVSRLRSSPTTKPYNILSDSINYWLMWAPSEEDGVNVLSEVAIEPDFQTTTSDVRGARPVPRRKVSTHARTIPSDEWCLRNLFYYVGIPVPGDAKQSKDAVIERWSKVYRLSPESAEVTDEVYQKWLDYASRRILEERNTLLGISSGLRPSVHPVRRLQHVDGSTRDHRILSEQRELFWHPRRALYTDLKDFLGALQFKGDNVGSLFTENELSLPKFPGKHQVVIVSRSERDVGIFRTHTETNISLVMLSLGSSRIHRMKKSPGSSPTKHEVYPPWVGGVRDTTALSKLKWSYLERYHGLVHELSHTFGLGEEYGGHEGSPSKQKRENQINQLYPNVHAFEQGQVDLDLLPEVWKELLPEELANFIKNNGNRPLDAPTDGSEHHCKSPDTDGVLIGLAEMRDTHLWEYLADLSPPEQRRALRGRLLYVVGLFTGGAGYDCNVYHPSPNCRMRLGRKNIPFCTVCQRALVKQIDKEKLSEL